MKKNYAAMFLYLVTILTVITWCCLLKATSIFSAVMQLAVMAHSQVLFTGI